MAFIKEKLELELAEAELQAQRALLGFGPAQKRVFIFCLAAIIPVYIGVRETALHLNLGRYRRAETAAVAAVRNPQPPQTGDVVITSTGTGDYSVAARLTNPNLTLSLDNAGYDFLLYNDQNQQVGDVPGKLYLLPGESKYLILPKFQTTETVTGAGIKFPDSLPWQKRLNIPAVTLSASSPAFSNQQNPPAFVVQGTIYNNSPYQINEVDIGFLLRDGAGKILAASSRAEFTLAPFERRAYVQLWPGVYTTQIASVDVLPETDVLNSANLTLPSAPITPASSFSR